MKNSRYSYNGNTIDYTLIAKAEVYSYERTDDALISDVSSFIRNKGIEDFDNLVIINSITNDSSNPIDEISVGVSFKAFMYYELDMRNSDIIITSLDMYNNTRSDFINLVTVYVILGFISIDSVFNYDDALVFVAPTTRTKSFVQKIVEVMVDKL